jgi:DNA (cytosine-5)-methyltransferase 1
MKYLSLCSGIEAASVAWHHMGWQPTAFSEIEPFPSAVLAHHYPQTPNWGDMTRFKEWPDANINVLVGGTPCQSFSVAGLRKGLDDPRGNLMLTYLAIADRYRPKWVVWENVPGVLSSNSGRDFGAFLGGLGQLGYGFAYRVLDAQYFGLAQRRRRVFVVGCLGGWQRAAAVLFEQHSLQGHPAPSREQRQNAARAATSGVESGQWPKSVAPTLTADYADKMGLNHQHVHNQEAGLFVQTRSPIAFPANLSGTQCASAVGISSALGAENATAIAFDTTQLTSPANYSQPQAGDPCHPLAAGAHPPAIATAMQVRRLTPVECERLQGFPDNYTNIAWRKKPESPDGPRYKALGNSMAVPVMRWIGERINQVEQI